MKSVMRHKSERRLAEIRHQYERAPEPRDLFALEGSAHAQFETDQGEQLLREILRFLSRAPSKSCRRGRLSSSVRDV